MSLTSSDLQEIRHVVEEVVHPLHSETRALRNDIKEIYDMIADMQRRPTPRKEEAGISLPR